MSEDREDKRKTIISEADRVTTVRAPEETRIYLEPDKYETKIMNGHTWIGETDDLSTTRIAGAPAETVVVRRNKQADEEAASTPQKKRAKAGFSKARDVGAGVAKGVGTGISDLRRVRVADRRKFARFLKVVCVLLIIFVLEIGYFVYAAHVKKMPSMIKETQKELELTRKENALLEKEIQELGDYDSVEELRASWERLKDKLDKAAAGTSY